jgi:hypothetical protein
MLKSVFMKNFTFTFSLISLFTLFVISGCTKSTPDPSPSDPRSIFTGNWGVTETVTKNYYTTTITADPNSSDGVFISNFGASTIQAHAVVSGSSITVSNQQLSNGWTVNGTGTYASSKITWPYSINDGANLTSYIAIFTKL